ncbi:MAG: electron transfer flavoprotein subunit alpha [Planctomycetes bacterium]|nr:electron transfer flavoprotein subunit alpha [Planctomycetota bacterium]
MEHVLCLLHTDADGAVPQPAREAVTTALRLATELGGAALAIGVIGAGAAAAADQLAGTGVERFVAVDGPDFASSRYATDAAAAAAIARATEATVIVGPATARFARTLPGVARRLGGRIDTQVTGLAVDAGRVIAERWYYRQRIVTKASRTTRPWLLTLAPGIASPWQGEPGQANAERLAVELSAAEQRTRVVGIEQASSGAAQTIRPDADLLLVAGAGWTKKQADGQPHVADAARLVLGFLERTRASLGSSKSLVDQSAEGGAVMPFMTHLNQVGQTGSTPRHPKGLATCCHGEEPHVVGWRFIRERRAINLDPSCGWARGKADVLYVADAFEVMAKVNALLDGAS